MGGAVNLLLVLAALLYINTTFRLNAHASTINRSYIFEHKEIVNILTTFTFIYRSLIHYMMINELVLLESCVLVDGFHSIPQLFFHPHRCFATWLLQNKTWHSRTSSRQGVLFHWMKQPSTTAIAACFVVYLFQRVARTPSELKVISNGILFKAFGCEVCGCVIAKGEIRE